MVASFSRPGFQYCEPVFAARPGAAAEDDGAVLTMGFRDNEPNYTELVVLDGRDLGVQARVKFETRGPVTSSFHGVFKENREGERVFK